MTSSCQRREHLAAARTRVSNAVQVFLSYSRADEQYANELVDHLREHGIDVWIDNAVDYGSRWARVIKDNLQGAAGLMVIMSPDSEDSVWVEREIDEAEMQGKPIFPLLLRGRRFFRLADLQYEDVADGKLPSEEFVQRLRDAIDLADADRTIAALRTDLSHALEEEDFAGAIDTLERLEKFPQMEDELEALRVRVDDARAGSERRQRIAELRRDLTGAIRRREWPSAEELLGELSTLDGPAGAELRAELDRERELAEWAEDVASVERRIDYHAAALAETREVWEELQRNRPSGASPTAPPPALRALVSDEPAAEGSTEAVDEDGADVDADEATTGEARETAAIGEIVGFPVGADQLALARRVDAFDLFLSGARSELVDEQLAKINDSGDSTWGTKELRAVHKALKVDRRTYWPSILAARVDSKSGHDYDAAIASDDEIAYVVELLDGEPARIDVTGRRISVDRKDRTEFERVVRSLM